MKIFSTKYALTSGIEELETKSCDRSLIVIRGSSGFDYYLHDEGKEWHRTKKAAIIRAEEMRKKKNLLKMETLKFN